MKLVISKTDYNLLVNADVVMWNRWYRTGRFHLAEYKPYKKFKKLMFKTDILVVGGKVHKNRLAKSEDDYLVAPYDPDTINLRLPRKEKRKLQKLII